MDLTHTAVVKLNWLRDVGPMKGLSTWHILNAVEMPVVVTIPAVIISP